MTMLLQFQNLLALCVASVTLIPIQVLAQHQRRCSHDPTFSSTNSTSVLPSPYPSPSHYHHQRYTAQEIISLLGLIPNVEGGYYLETFRDNTTLPGSNRSVSTAIYYLLEGPDVPSVWHRVVDAVEVWHFYVGAPLSLDISRDDGTPTQSHLLGPDLFSDQRPQVVIPANEWQRATSHGDWTLVGTTGKFSLG
jgi:predicted cupin superfamily sugar epimerase